MGGENVVLEKQLILTQVALGVKDIALRTVTPFGGCQDHRALFDETAKETVFVMKMIITRSSPQR